MSLTEEEIQALRKIINGPFADMTNKTLYQFTRAAEYVDKNTADIEHIKQWNITTAKSVENLTLELAKLTAAAASLQSIGSGAKGYAKIAGSFLAGLVITAFSVAYIMHAAITWIKQALGNATIPK
jgi:hypothetical protein